MRARCLERPLKQNDGVKIQGFLLKKDFKFGAGARMEGSMRKIFYGQVYDVWFAFCGDHLSLYVEHKHGRKVDSKEFNFEKNDFASFFKAHNEAIEWADQYLK